MIAFLIAPPTSPHPAGVYPRHPPLLLASCAGALREAGATVHTVDAFAQDLPIHAVVSQVALLTPDLVVLLPNDVARETPAAVTAMLAGGLRRKLPEALLVAAGVGQPHWLAKLLKDVPQLDGAICGDPEEPLVAVHDLLAENGDWCTVPGAMTSSTSPVRFAGHICQELDSLPAPAWDLVQLNSYTVLAHRQRGGGEYPILASRGCFWDRCGFCQDLACVKSPVYRVRSPESVVSEMEKAIANFGASHFLFHDAVFPPRVEWLSRFSGLIIERGLKVTWFCMARADSVSPEGLKLMAQAGCINICFGLETGSPELLAAMDKGHDLEQSRWAVRQAQLAGLEVSATFILGYPGETPATARRTVEFAIDLDVDYAQFLLVKWHQVPDHLLDAGTLHEDWELTQFDYRGMLFVPSRIGTPERLKLLRSYAYLRFYSRPGYLAKQLRKVGGLSDLRRYVSGAKTLISAMLNR
jgi:anaerobic magnesium-protoporphyrin IX monomethyl ester cyclase